LELRDRGFGRLHRYHRRGLEGTKLLELTLRIGQRARRAIGNELRGVGRLLELLLLLLCGEPASDRSVIEIEAWRQAL